MRTVKCAYCGKEFRCSEYRIKISKNICCSNECRYKFNKKQNEIIIKDNYAEVITTKGNILISKEDIEKVKQYCWYINNDGYAQTSVQIGRKNKRGIHKIIQMHRFLMNVENQSFPLIDHINRNPLDNRRENLRLADFKTNVLNSRLRKDSKTGYKCVFLNKKTSKYYSQVRRDGKVKYLGSAATLEEAKNFYDRWVLESEANND